MRDDRSCAERLRERQFRWWQLLLALVLASAAIAIVAALDPRGVAAVLTGGTYGVVLALAVGTLATRHLAYLSAERSVLRPSCAVMWTGWLYGVALCAFFAGVGGWTAAGESLQNAAPPGLVLVGCLLVANVFIPSAVAIAAFGLGLPFVALLAGSLPRRCERHAARVVASVAGGIVGWVAWPVLDADVLDKPGTFVLFVLLPGTIGSVVPAVLLWMADRREAGRGRAAE